MSSIWIVLLAGSPLPHKISFFSFVIRKLSQGLEVLEACGVTLQMDLNGRECSHLHSPLKKGKVNSPKTVSSLPQNISSYHTFFSDYQMPYYIIIINTLSSQ